jgi:hypothetical protein
MSKEAKPFQTCLARCSAKAYWRASACWPYPEWGPVLAVGPLAAAVTGAIAGAATGGFAGSLAGLGISEAEAIAAQRHMKAGLERFPVVVNRRGIHI